MASPPARPWLNIFPFELLMNLDRITLPADFVPAEQSLAGRVVLVTGAGQGLGKVAATVFARHGATVVLHGRTTAKLEATYDEIEAAGGPQGAILPLDLAKATQADFDAFARAVHAALGRLDGIFHAASHFVSTMPMALYDLEMWQLHAKVNLIAPAALTRACMPMLKRSANASVVFLTETHAEQPKAYWGPFAATKSALSALVAAWADECEANPRFNLCLPGPVASPMRSKSHPGEASATLPDASSLSDAFLYLIGPASDAVTGKLLVCGKASG